jgi:hypothetical protein
MHDMSHGRAVEGNSSRLYADRIAGDLVNLPLATKGENHD